jgi:PrtD family type I secretion system ABC transporter
MQYPTWQTVQDKLRKSFLLLLGLSFFTNLAALALPLYTLQFFDRVLYSNSKETLAMLAIALGVVGIAYLGFDTLRRRILPLFASYLEKQLSEPLLLNATDNPQWQTQHHQQLYGAVMELKRFFYSPTILATIDTLWSPLFIAVLFLIHPWFGVLLLTANSLFLITAIAQHYSLKTHWKSQDQQQQQLNQRTAILSKNKQAMSSMGMSQHWIDQNSSEHEQLNRLQHRTDRLTRRFELLTQSFKWLLQAALPTIGALLLISQTISAGAMLAALIIGARAILPFEALIQHWKAINQAKTTMQDIKQALVKGTDREEHTPPVSLTGRLQIKGLSIQAGSRNSPILNKLHFTVAPGQVLAIIGANGVGKSLLMRTLLAQHMQKKGDILFDSIQLGNIDKAWLGQQVGYVPQAIQLPADKINNIICRHQTIDREELVKASKAAGITEAILALPNGYETLINSDTPLSPGLMQRIALARAFYNSPQYLFFDEADAFLDQSGSDAYCRAIRQAKKQNKTVIFITQRRTALSLADRVLFLDNGQQTFYGTPEEMDNLTSNDKESRHENAR